MENSKSPQEVIQQFFGNYALLPEFKDFMDAQSKLLAPDMVTIVKNFGHETPYFGPDGYFKSIQDWSKLFSTGKDLKVTVNPHPDARGAYKVHLSGTITVTNKDGSTFSVPPDGHHWSETFVLGPDNKIHQLTVDMGIAM